jgi:hypothetical protein
MAGYPALDAELAKISTPRGGNGCEGVVVGNFSEVDRRLGNVIRFNG